MADSIEETRRNQTWQPAPVRSFESGESEVEGAPLQTGISINLAFFYVECFLLLRVFCISVETSNSPGINSFPALIKEKKRAHQILPQGHFLWVASLLFAFDWSAFLTLVLCLICFLLQECFSPFVLWSFDFSTICFHLCSVSGENYASHCWGWQTAPGPPPPPTIFIYLQEYSSWWQQQSESHFHRGPIQNTCSYISADEVGVMEPIGKEFQGDIKVNIIVVNACWLFQENEILITLILRHAWTGTILSSLVWFNNLLKPTSL